MKLKVQRNRNLSEFSTFGIGGPIRYFIEVSNIEQMCEALRSSYHPKLVIGRGSNCLFSDAGFSGLVILNRIEFCHWKDSFVDVGSGYSFSLLGIQSARRGLAGLEFASGIPASVGGAIFMNAGANGGETSRALSFVEVFDGKKRMRLFKKDLQFDYRFSSFQGMKSTLLSARFCLKKEKKARNIQLEIVKARLKTQPVRERSIGCIFRNPLKQSAGGLIDKCNLKGIQVGGARVSQMHANFIINVNKATAEDVKKLIALVREKVFEQTGILLEPELRVIDEQ